MSKRAFIGLTLLSVGATAFFGFGDLSAIGAIGVGRLPANAVDSRAATQVAPVPVNSFKERAGLISRMKNRWSRFRPVAKGPQAEWANAEKILATQTTLQKIFNREFSQEMANRYYAGVRPLEQELQRPGRWNAQFEVRRYEESRKALAAWTVKEAGQKQLKDFARRHRENSTAVDVMAAASGFQEDKPTSSPSAKPEAYSPGGAPDEETPTRLRARMNLIKTYGQLTFSNPVVVTSVEARAGSGSNLAVEMNREFRKLEMKSRVRYGVDESLLVFNVNKKITDEVSVDLNSERWTGSKRGSVGEKSKDTAQVLYQVSF